MPLHKYRPLPPTLDIIVPAAPALLTLSTATATTSPAPDSPVTNKDSNGTLPHRSGSTRLDRVRELLAPIGKGSPTSSLSFYSSSSVRPVGAEGLEVGKAETGKVKMVAGSQIEFFERHPCDSRNPVTFLGGGFGGGDGGGGSGRRSSEGEKQEGMVGGETSVKEKGREEEKEEVSAPYACTSFHAASPPRDIPGAAAAATVGLADPPSPSLTPYPTSPIPIPTAHPEDSYTIHEVPILEARPATLYEMPGRFRSSEVCWYCADWTMGARCRICGARIRGVCRDERRY